MNDQSLLFVLLVALSINERATSLLATFGSLQIKRSNLLDFLFAQMLGSKHPKSVKFVLKHKIFYQIQIVVLFDLNDGKVIENILSSSCVTEMSN